MIIYLFNYVLQFNYKMEEKIQELRTTAQPYSFIDKHRKVFWMLGIFGGLLIQLVLGSVYQWGIVNIYITSYFRTIDTSVTLQGNAIIFPIIMLMTAPTLRLGLYLAQKSHPILVLGVNHVLLALVVFISSYVQSMLLFAVFYGFLFGLLSGVSYMIPLIECNKLIPGRKLVVNGIILIGTGIGSLVFGLFSYSYLNPDRLSPIGGYYSGNQQLVDIALKVPSLLRYLSLLYLLIGLTGVALLTPVVMDNRRRIQQQFQRISQHAAHLHFDIQERHLDHKQAETVCQGIKSLVFWTQLLIVLLLPCGPFLINGNYKTYVKAVIKDDYFLTIVGVIGSLANGCSRFLWSLYFTKTGYKTVILTAVGIQILVFSTIRFTTAYKGLFLIEVLLANACIGATFSLAPSFSQLVFGQRTGSNIYGLIFLTIASSNFIQFGYVKGLVPLIGFNGIIYICLGMSVLIIPIIYFSTFRGPWHNSTVNVEYCVGRQLAEYNRIQAQKAQKVPYSANRLINIMVSDQEQLQRNAPLPMIPKQFQRGQKQKQLQVLSQKSAGNQFNQLDISKSLRLKDLKKQQMIKDFKNKQSDHVPHVPQAKCQSEAQINQKQITQTI